LTVVPTLSDVRYLLPLIFSPLYSVGDACIYYSWCLFSFFFLQGCILCDFFIVSISIFRSWMGLFNSFTCLVVFSFNSSSTFLSFLFKVFYLFICVCLFFLRELFMSFLKLSIIIMRYDRVLLFWCVGVFRVHCGGRTGFWWCPVALVSVSYVFALAFHCLVISDVSSSCCLWLWLVPPASLCVSTPGRPVFYGKNLGMKSYRTGSALGCRQKPEGSCPQMLLDSCVTMVLGRSLLGQEFEQKWWHFLSLQIFQLSWESSSLLMVFVCKPLCQYSWETSFLWEEFGYKEVWYRISSGCRWETEDSFPKMLLRSCVLRVPGVSICVAVVVLLALTGLSALLGD
jgi:hypothetical protein